MLMASLPPRTPVRPGRPWLPLLLLACCLLPARALWAQATPPYDHPLFTGPAHDVPIQPFDQEHLRLDLRFDFEARTVAGAAVLRVRPLDDSLHTLVLFGAGLQIDSLQASFPGGRRVPASYRTGGADSLVIRLDSLAALAGGTLRADRAFEVHVAYTARPRRGLFFVPPGAHSPHPQLWSQGEPEDNRHWFPSFDTPGDRLTSEIYATVDRPLLVLSNGLLVEERDNPDGTVTFHYLQRQPHPTYLVSLVVGAYQVVPGTFPTADGRRLPLAYWVYPDRAADVERTFGRTPEMMRFFSGRLHYPFPWPQYAQAVAHDFHFGGMENTGATTLSDHVLIDERAALDDDPDALIAHELAHQWFGDLVTAEYWSDVWLNEGFATYLAARYAAHAEGEDALALRLQARADGYLAEAARYRRPLVWHRWEAPLQMFDAHSYDKGAWVLHMLHEQVGDAAFWEILDLYLKWNQYGSVDTGYLQRAVEAVVQEDFTPFFDQWVYAAGHPVLDVAYAYRPEAQALEVTIRQQQTGFEVPDVFALDLALEVHTLADSARFEVPLRAREETFTFPLAMAPRYVVLDPERDVLAEVRVTQPATAWVAQLRYAAGVASRIQAARALVAFKEDPALLIALRNALEREAVPGVRAEIVRTLGSLPPSAAGARALVDAYDDAAPAVREAVLTALGTFKELPEAAALATRAAEAETSYRVQAAAVRTLARLGAPGALDIARAALVTPSHREVVRQAAFDALAHLDLPAREALETGRTYSRADQPTEVRTAALRYLGTLAPTEARAREYLVDRLGDPLLQVRRAAALALRGIDADAVRTALRQQLEREPHPLVRAALQEALAAAPVTSE